MSPACKLALQIQMHNTPPHPRADDALTLVLSGLSKGKGSTA